MSLNICDKFHIRASLIYVGSTTVAIPKIVPSTHPVGIRLRWQPPVANERQQRQMLFLASGLIGVQNRLGGRIAATNQGDGVLAVCDVGRTIERSRQCSTA